MKAKFIAQTAPLVRAVTFWSRSWPGQSLWVCRLRIAILYKKQIGTHREKKHVLTLTLMLVRRKSACKTSAGSSKIFRWLAPLLGPNLDPKTGPKQRPKRRNENVIQFWTPFWGPYLDPKMGSAIGEFRCCPQMFCKQICDPAAWTWMSTHTFSLCASQGRLLLSRSLYRSHVLSTFFGPVLGAMMKQVCWHSGRSEAVSDAKRNGTRTKRGSRGLESI